MPLIHRRLVLGFFDIGELGDKQPINLMSWIPPDDWGMQVFSEVMPEGQCVMVPPFSDIREATQAEITPGLRNLARELRKVGPPLRLPEGIPIAAALLASLRYHRPLPPELWRRRAFPDTGGQTVE